MANSMLKLLPVLLVTASVTATAVADDRVDKLNDDLREWLEMEVVYIITDIERDIFLDLETREERMRFIQAFWDRRDPDPATLENEFQVEHYRRLDYANTVLARDSPRPGWRTDRGRYYIILGEPSEIQRYDAYNELVASELWIYQGDVTYGLPPRFNLLFYKDNDIGEYKLYNPMDGPQKILRAGYADQRWTVNQHESLNAITGISAELAQATLTIDLTELTGYEIFSGRGSVDPLELRVRPSMNVQRTLANIVTSPMRRVDTRDLEGYKKYGHMVTADYSFKYFPSRSVFAILYGPDTTPFVHFGLEIDPKHFTLEVDERGTRHYTTVEVDLEIRDLEGHVVGRNVNQPLLQMSASQFERASTFPVAYRDNFPVIPGDYKVSVVLKNRATKDYTAAETDLQVPKVEPGVPALSDLVLGYGGEDSLKDATVHRSFQVGTSEVYPTAAGAFAVGENVQAFVQVLNAEPGQTIRFQILGPEGDVIDEERADAAEGAVVRELTLLGVDGGYYQARAQLIDAGGVVLASKSAQVTVTPRTEVARPAFIYRHSFNTDVPGLMEMAVGNQLMAVGRIQEAAAAYEKAAENPQLPMAKWRLAGIVLFDRDADRALELLTPLEADFPNEYEVIEGLAFAYYIKEDYARAKGYLERSAKIRSPDTIALNALGDCYERLGDIEKAKEQYQRSLTMKPDQKGVQARLASLSGGD